MEISLVVPAHNEEGNLERLVNRVLAAEFASEYEIEIVLVDDNSTDRTPEICDRLATDHNEVTALHRQDRPGFGNAIKAGLAGASGDILIPFMGDLSDDPEDVSKLVEGIESGNDFVYGSRFTDRGTLDGYSPLKMFYNRAYNNLIRVLFGIKSRDVTNAFSAYRREVIEGIDVESLSSESFDLTAELPLRAHIAGFRSDEVPVSWRSRDEGVSKLNATKKGPLYIKRLLHMFLVGNAAGLRDLFGAITSGGWLRVLGAGILGVLILLGVFSASGFGDVHATLLQTNAEWLALGALMYFTSFLFRTWRYRVLLRTAEHLASRTGVMRAILAGWFVNFILPARAGDAARGIALKTTEGVPISVGVGLIVVERILDMIVLGTVMVLTVGLFLDSSEGRLLAAAAFGIAMALIAGLSFIYAFDRRITNALSTRFPRVADSIVELNRSLERVVRNPYAMALALLLSVPVWGLEMSTIYFSARAVGVSLGGVGTITVAISGFLAQTVPVTPAGIGTYEAVLAATLSVFGIATSTGTTIAVLDHFTRAAVTYVAGAISIIHIGFQSRVYFRQQRHEEASSETSHLEN